MEKTKNYILRLKQEFFEIWGEYPNTLIINEELYNKLEQQYFFYEGMKVLIREDTGKTFVFKIKEII